MAHDHSGQLPVTCSVWILTGMSMKSIRADKGRMPATWLIHGLFCIILARAVETRSDMVMGWGRVGDGLGLFA